MRKTSFNVIKETLQNDDFVSTLQFLVMIKNKFAQCSVLSA